ncbi:helicase HerA domain-containing protein [Archaeoglobus sp.]
MRRVIGRIIGKATAKEFEFMLSDKSAEKEDLMFSYVEVEVDGDPIIGRIVDVRKENPLLNLDQAGALAKELIEEMGNLTIPPERFTRTVAECEVVGVVRNGRLEQNRKPLPPGSNVYPISEECAKILFYNDKSSYIPIGTIESFGSTGKTPITVNGDELVTKHFAIFGMTGSGKTNTSARVIEELAIRGYRIVIFDPHDDYKNITKFNTILKEYDKDIDKVRERLFEMIKKQLNEKINISKDDVVPLLVTLTLVYNQPISNLLKGKELDNLKFSEEVISLLKDTEKIQKLLNSQVFRNIRNINDKIEHYCIFPEIKFYGDNFEDFTIKLMEGFLGEEFTDAQKRYLRRIIGRSRSYVGLVYINQLQRIISNDQNLQDKTKNALLQKLDTLKYIYIDLLRSGAIPCEINEIAKIICKKGKSDINIHRFSLSALPDRLRKLTVWAIVSYIFRMYKFKLLNENERYPLLFILEEARSLIPSKATAEKDYAGWLAVMALRDLAYEGRKFKLAYGLISQKPSTVDEEVSSQCNTLILHRLKSPDDQEYVRKVTEGLTKVEIDMLKNIDTGKAVITGTAITSTILVKVSKRYSEEGIEEPKPLSEETDIAKEIETLKGELGIQRT